MTTIATWNLHHMGREQKIPNGVTEVIALMKPDVLVLTEYVDRDRRSEFVASLDKIGYRGRRCSPEGEEPRQNQVLIAAQCDLEAEKLAAPDIDEAARTNFLHCRIPTLDLEIVGFRVPHYQSEKPVRPEKLVNYWRQFTKMMLGVASRKVVLIGDFNVGTKGVDAAGQAALRKLVKAGYRMLAEEGGLDRALVSPKLAVRSFSITERSAGHALCGKGGLSDHPMLMVEVE